MLELAYLIVRRTQHTYVTPYVITAIIFDNRML